MKRAWSDPQMYTHMAFLPALWIALCRDPPMFDLVLLLTAVCVLSLWYHRNREHECTLASIEHTFAHALFAYAVAQTILSPGMWILMANLACACATSTVYVVTYDNKALWERWHAIGLHVIPGFWSAIIASYHDALFDFVYLEL